MNLPVEIPIEKSQDKNGIPDYQYMLNETRRKLFEQWKAADPSRKNSSKFPRKIFQKDSNLRSHWEFLVNKVNVVYTEWMTDLYYDWIEKHNNRPYLMSKDPHEFKLAKWFSKQLRKGHPPQDILEKHRELPFNHVREYQEWRHVFRRYPSIRSQTGRERRLAKWSIAVRLKYNQGELPEDQAEYIRKNLGEEWLENVPFLKNKEKPETATA